MAPTSMNELMRRMDKMESNQDETAKVIHNLQEASALTLQGFQQVQKDFQRLESDPERGNMALHTRVKNIENGNIRTAGYIAGAIMVAMLVGSLLYKGVDYFFPHKDPKLDAIFEAIKAGK